jgi:polar amino acid transport system substrate-binding protein
MKMKKAVSVMIVVLSLIFVFGGCGNPQKSVGGSTNQNSAAASSKENSLNGIKDKGKFIVGLDDTFAPMGFRDEKGEIVGFDIDMAKEVAKRLGVSVEFKPVEWDGILLSLKSKDIDVIWNGLTITDERKQQIDFSKPYLENRQIIIVKSGSNIKSKSDLSGKIVGLQLGSSSEKALNSDETIANSLKELRKYSTNAEALLDLKNGRIDAVVADEVLGRYYIQKDPKAYVILDDDFGKEKYGVGIRKEDSDFKAAIDKALDEIKADGTADKISVKWFGKVIVTK